MKNRLPWGLLLPPLCSLVIAGAVIRYQSVRHDRIATELREAKQEAVRLEKMLPPGQKVIIPEGEDPWGDHDHHH